MSELIAEQSPDLLQAQAFCLWVIEKYDRK
jgi:hypothetical protein